MAGRSRCSWTAGLSKAATRSDPVSDDRDRWPQQMQTTLFEAINHGADGNLFDREIRLLLSGVGAVQLQFSATATDGDGDPNTQTATIDLITTRRIRCSRSTTTARP